MKNLCRKGKVHPSPAAVTHKDAFSVLKLLPVAIATLSAALIPEDQEVLAYLIACSLEVQPLHEKNKKKMSLGRTHRPVFECCCFQCYTSFWSRWDASPNRELIHEAIDLFEDHLAAIGGSGGDIMSRAGKPAAASSSSSSSGNGKGKNRKGSKAKDETNREKQLISWLARDSAAKEGKREDKAKGKETCNGVSVVVEQGVSIPDKSCQQEDLVHGNGKEMPKLKQVVPVDFGKEDDKSRPSSSGHDKKVSLPRANANAHPVAGRGLMRRVFPDIMGFVAEHLWTVWSPAV